MQWVFLHAPGKLTSSIPLRKALRIQLAQQNCPRHRDCTALFNVEIVVSEPREKRLYVRRKEVELAKAILEYLAEHPDAHDTAEGIASFWVMRQKVKEEVKDVSRVLRQLTKSGQLEKVKRGDHVLYRLRKERSDLNG